MEGLGEMLAASPLLERLRAAEAVADAADAWVVGGSVRDLLAGATAFPDVDIAVAGDTRRAANRLADALGGTLVPLDEDRHILRVATPDGAIFDLTRVATTIDDDLARRDLTMNAMALPLRDALDAPERVRLVDPFHGAEDLAARTVRLVSECALTDDPLRLLRVYRFAAALGATTAPETAEAVARHAALIERPAPERVARELFLLLDTPHATRYLREMDAAGLLGAALPEAEAMRAVTQNEYHHLDVLAHSLEAVACLDEVLADLPGLVGDVAPKLDAFLGEKLASDRTRRALVKFASLLHDVGKPAARAVKGGRVIFHTHNVLGAEIMRDVCGRLRLSTRESEEAVRYVYRHMIPGDLEAAGRLDERREMRFFRRNGECALTLSLLSLADGMATRGPKADPERTQRFRAFVRTLAEDYYGQVGRKLQSPPIVNGRDLIAELGVAPGPELGRLLKRIRHRQLVGEVKSREDALALARREIAKRASEAQRQRDEGE